MKAETVRTLLEWVAAATLLAIVFAAGVTVGAICATR